MQLRFGPNPSRARSRLMVALATAGALCATSVVASDGWRDRRRLDKAWHSSVAPLYTIAQPASTADPLGDTFGVAAEQIDIASFSAVQSSEELVLRLEMSAMISPPGSGEPRAIDGFVEIDLDQDPTTGDPSFIRFLTGAQIDLGVELVADLLTYDANDGSVDLLDLGTDLVRGRVPVVGDGNTITITIPAALLGDDDLRVHTAALVGTLVEPTDVVPNKGFVSSDDTDLFLQDGRFRVGVTWTDFDGNSGSGRVVPVQGADSGLFYFFDADNWEVLVKVLNGCFLNQRYWVFFAATTNLQFELTVEDIFGENSVRYTNPLGQAANAVTDTNAFATCP